MFYNITHDFITPFDCLADLDKNYQQLIVLTNGIIQNKTFFSSAWLLFCLFVFFLMPRCSYLWVFSLHAKLPHQITSKSGLT